MTPRRLTPEETEAARSTFLEKYPGYYVLSSYFFPGSEIRRGKDAIRGLFLNEEMNKALDECVYIDMMNFSSEYFTKLFAHEDKEANPLD